MSNLENSQDAFIREWAPRINQLSESELRMLNELVVHKIKLMQKARSLVAMAQFNIGEVVSFIGSDGQKRVGKVIKVNPKTISVQTKAEGYWNVSPALLKKEP